MSPNSATHEFHCVTPERAKKLATEVPPDSGTVTGRRRRSPFRSGRVRIFHLLSQDELSVHNLAAMPGMGQSAVPRHLEVLGSQVSTNGTPLGGPFHPEFESDYLFSGPSLSVTAETRG